MTQVSAYLLSLLGLIWSYIIIIYLPIWLVITNLEQSKASGLDCILTVALKNSETELLHILVELFNICQIEFVFQIVGRSHFWSLYLIHSTPKLPPYRNQSIDLLCKSINWFLYGYNFGLSTFAFELRMLRIGLQL